MTNLDSILKSRNIILPTKVHLVKAMVFPVITYKCETWAIKKAECQRTDIFELWCWRRLLRIPWTAIRSNQSILKEISPQYSSEGLMLKLELQYFGHLTADLLGKTLILGKTEDRRRRGRQDEMAGWHRLLNGHDFEQTAGESKRQGSVACCSPWGEKESVFSSVSQSCLTLCDPMNRSTPGLPGHHQLPEFTQTHVHRVSDAIQPSHPLSSPSPPALNPSQHQSLFK